MLYVGTLSSEYSVVCTQDILEQFSEWSELFSLFLEIHSYQYGAEK